MTHASPQPLRQPKRQSTNNNYIAVSLSRLFQTIQNPRSEMFAVDILQQFRVAVAVDEFRRHFPQTIRLIDCRFQTDGIEFRFLDVRPARATVARRQTFAHGSREPQICHRLALVNCVWRADKYLIEFIHFTERDEIRDLIEET